MGATEIRRTKPEIRASPPSSARADSDLGPRATEDGSVFEKPDFSRSSFIPAHSLLGEELAPLNGPLSGFGFRLLS